MKEIVKTSRSVEMDEADLISLEDAAKLSKRTVSVISGMLDRGTLPWYEFDLPDVPAARNMRIRRLTSRAAVEAIGKPSKK